MLMKSLIYYCSYFQTNSCQESLSKYKDYSKTNENEQEISSNEIPAAAARKSGWLLFQSIHFKTWKIFYGNLPYIMFPSILRRQVSDVTDFHYRYIRVTWLLERWSTQSYHCRPWRHNQSLKFVWWTLQASLECCPEMLQGCIVPRKNRIRNPRWRPVLQFQFCSSNLQEIWKLQRMCPRERRSNGKWRLWD